MSLRELYCVRCDAVGCAARGPVRPNPVEAGTLALARGWRRGTIPSHGITLHLCPACAGKPRPDWWPGGEGN